MISRRVTSSCEHAAGRTSVLVSATMKPAMKQNAGATGMPVNRVRNCQMSAGKLGAQCSELLAAASGIEHERGVIERHVRDQYAAKRVDVTFASIARWRTVRDLYDECTHVRIDRKSSRVDS